MTNLGNKTYSFPLGVEYDEKKLCKLTRDIFTYLEQSPKTWERAHVFVGGEGDTNQTKFESLSNRCKIGVVAYNKETGYALLHFLRMIIDGHSLNFTVECTIDIVEAEKVTVKDIINSFESTEGTYGNNFPFGEILTSTLYGESDEQHITVNPEDADLWNLARIKEKILSNI